MIIDLRNRLVALTAIFLVVACEPATEEMAVETLSVPGLDEPANMLLVAADTDQPAQAGALKAYNDLLSQRGETRGIVKKTGGIVSDLPLGRLISETRRNGGQDAPGLAGIGGVPGHIFLDLAEGKVGGNDEYDPIWTITIDDRKGQILEYVYRDPATGDGRMVVMTEVTWTRTHRNNQVPPQTWTDRYKFDVSVVGGFGATKKKVPGDSGYDPDDVFPGTIIRIPAQMAGPFDWKVHGLGEDVIVNTVWFDHNRNGTFQPNERFTAQTATGWQRKYLSLFDVSPENCIDMMVVAYSGNTPPVPMNKAELITSVENSGEPLRYCLGRCEDPPLINTR